jgi:hypothetical protein
VIILGLTEFKKVKFSKETVINNVYWSRGDNSELKLIENRAGKLERWKS